MKTEKIENEKFTEFIRNRLHKLCRGKIVSFYCPVCGNVATVVCSIHDESVYAHCPHCGSYTEFEKRGKQ